VPIRVRHVHARLILPPAIDFNHWAFRVIVLASFLLSLEYLSRHFAQLDAFRCKRSDGASLLRTGDTLKRRIDMLRIIASSEPGRPRISLTLLF